MSVWCIKSFISSFAPKTASLNSLRHDSVVLWTQARSLVLKNVVKLLLNFGKNKCSDTLVACFMKYYYTQPI